MSNHYNREVETQERHLNRAMQWLKHVYEGYRNREHGRVGHLFHGKYESVLIEAETDLHFLFGNLCDSWVCFIT